MLETLHVNMPPAQDGAGRAPVTEPEELARCRRMVEEHPLMQALPTEAARAFVLELGRFTRYLAGYAAMSAGDPPDRIAMVLSGRCRVFDPARPEVTIGWVGPGECLGELSHLTGRPRTLTVGVVRDTVVIEVDRTRLIDEGTAAAALVARGWLARIAAERALGLTRRRPPGMNLTVIGLEAGVGRVFADELASALRSMGDTCAVRSEDDWPALPTSGQLADVEEAHDYVIYVADPAASSDPWSRRWLDQVLRQGDRVLLVADAAIAAGVRDFEGLAASALAPTVLVLLQPADIERATDTARWLDPRPGMMHLHVRRGRVADFARCARLVTRRGRGVAFAGASSRGIGYSGVAKAFEEVGFVPDVVAGNSSGSMAAACLGAGFDAAKTLAAYRAGLNAVKPGFGTLTLPFVSFLSGARASAYCRAQLGDIRLEDMLIPCVITAVDLGTLSMVDQRFGPAWRAVRASGSLPVYYPPVCDGREVLVDGGVLENFPVRPLESLCGDGFVLIGDLSQSPTAMSAMVPYGTQISGWRVLLDRVWPFNRSRRWPGVAEVMFRTACLASLKNQMELQARPGWHFIRPDTPAIGLFGASETELPRLVEDSRAHAVEVLTTTGDPAVEAALSRA